MFFPACEHIANEKADLREQIRIIDEKLSTFLPTATIQPSLIANATDLDEDVLTDILQSLAAQRLLVKRTMIRCQRCKTLIADDLYSQALDNDESLECTACDRIVDSPESNRVTVYQFSDAAKELLKSRSRPKPSDAVDHTQKMQIVLLIHGIRTSASWQGMVKQVLERQGRTIVSPIKYGYLDAIRFWSPLFTRRWPIHEVLYKMRHAIAEHPEAELIIVAHSFGTYAITKILEKNPDIRPKRVIFCGSIVSRRLRWDLLPNRPALINDCGSRDIWPVLATSTTWGYGETGTFGFGFPTIRDRHHDMAHSDYFNQEFVETFWRPWVHDGRDVPSEFETNQPPAPLWMSLLTLLPLKYLLVATILGLVGCVGYLLVN